MSGPSGGQPAPRHPELPDPDPPHHAGPTPLDYDDQDSVSFNVALNAARQSTDPRIKAQLQNLKKWTRTYRNACQEQRCEPIF